MKRNHFTRNVLIFVGLMGLMVVTAIKCETHPVRATTVPTSAVVVQQPDANLQQAIFNIAKVFGKGNCGDYALAEKIARVSLKQNVPPTLMAATVTVESTCNPMAISKMKAVGLTQVHVPSWRSTYDFTVINLLNPDQNLEIGTQIYARLLHQYPVHQAVLHYNNMDEGYATKILNLAGLK